MSAVHPFLKRIRTERTIISLVNKWSDYFDSDLTGLSREAVRVWFNGISKPIRSKESVKRVRDRLEYIGQLSKLASNGSHRGAMVAPSPNEEVTKQLVYEINKTLVKMSSNNVNHH
ncbi:MAG: hypothetical protein O7D86_03705 [Proteobacteria bacterium]|nr:hypothetical protein [Pseudomonadota bacterium]